MLNDELNIVILSAGKATRLEKATLSDYLPKCLVPVAGKAAALRQCEYYQKYFPNAKLHFIVRHKHKQLLEATLANAKQNASVHCDDECDGTARTLGRLLKDEQFADCSLLIQWADILPYGNAIDLSNSFIGLGRLGEITGGYYLYAGEFCNAKHKPVPDVIASNSMGIYFFNRLSILAEAFQDAPIGADVADVLVATQSLTNGQNITSYDFGTQDLLDKCNSILPYVHTIRETQLIKRSANKLFKPEPEQADWFELVGDTIATPYIGKEPGGYTMHNLAHAVPLLNCMSNANCQLVVDELKVLHNAMPKQKADLKLINELAYYRPVNRLQAIKHLLSDREFADLLIYIRKAHHLLLANADNQSAVFVHGDVSPLNVLMQDGKPIFIDPRVPANCMPEAFEYGKLVFSFCGWASVYFGESFKPTPMPACVSKLAEDKHVRAWAKLNMISAPAMFSQDPLRLWQMTREMVKYVL